MYSDARMPTLEEVASPGFSKASGKPAGSRSVCPVAAVWSGPGLHTDSAPLKVIYSEDRRICHGCSEHWARRGHLHAHFQHTPPPPPPSSSGGLLMPQNQIQNFRAIGTLISIPFERQKDSIYSRLLPFPKFNVVNIKLKKINKGINSHQKENTDSCHLLVLHMQEDSNQGTWSKRHPKGRKNAVLYFQNLSTRWRLLRLWKNKISKILRKRLVFPSKYK